MSKTNSNGLSSEEFFLYNPVGMPSAKMGESPLKNEEKFFEFECIRERQQKPEPVDYQRNDAPFSF